MKKLFMIGCGWTFALLAMLAIFPGVAISDTESMVSLLDVSSVGIGGMLINSANLNNIYQNIKTTFQKTFDALMDLGHWKKTTMIVQSTSRENDYKWLGKVPKMVKWLGEKQIKKLKAFKYLVENEDFEGTIEVDRNDIEDDQLGMLPTQATSWGEAAAEWYDELDADLKNNAFVNPCYDEQFFYDTDHPVDDEDGNEISQSNKGTAPLSNATLAAAQASIGAAMTALNRMTGDGGRPLGIEGDTLEVPPELRDVANLLANNDKLADDSPNPYKGAFVVIVNPRLTSITAWFFHNTKKAVKPFIIQERKKPMFVRADDPKSDAVFSTKTFKYGVEARGAGAYGLYQLSYGSTGTG